MGLGESGGEERGCKFGEDGGDESTGPNDGDDEGDEGNEALYDGDGEDGMMMKDERHPALSNHSPRGEDHSGKPRLGRKMGLRKRTCHMIAFIDVHPP